MKILIIDDDSELSAAMADYLELKGALCDFAFNGAAGLSLASEQVFDVIILDLMMPKMNGHTLCSRLREQGNGTPVLMLTASDTDKDQLEGFRSGVDDYVIKPCPMPLIWARLQALLRRQQAQSDAVCIDQLQIWFSQRRVTREGRELKLTPTGWRLLEYLVRQSPRVVPRAELEQFAWPDGEVESGNFNVQLHQLRKAVDKPFAYPLIQTVVGVGLVLRRSPEQENEHE